MSEEGQKFIDALHHYLLHEYIVPILASATAAGIGYFGGKRKRDSEADKLQVEAHTLAIDAITRNFQVLISGYESRIGDLTREVELLRDEVGILQKALERRINICQTNCDNFSDSHGVECSNLKPKV